MIWSTFGTNTIFAFLSVSWVNQSRYKETTPQKQLKYYWSFCDCFWRSCIMAMCTKCFLKQCRFYLHSFPFVFWICKLSTMVAFYCIKVYKLSTIFALYFLTWLHIIPHYQINKKHGFLYSQNSLQILCNLLHQICICNHWNVWLKIICVQ